MWAHSEKILESRFSSARTYAKLASFRKNTWYVKLHFLLVFFITNNSSLKFHFFSFSSFCSRINCVFLLCDWLNFLVSVQLFMTFSAILILKLHLYSPCSFPLGQPNPFYLDPLIFLLICCPHFRGFFLVYSEKRMCLLSDFSLSCAKLIK